MLLRYRSYLYRCAVFLVLLLTFATSVRAQPMPSVIKVGYILHKPFVIDKKGAIVGMSVDIWELVAKENGWEYTYVPKPYSLDAGFQALEDKKIDVLIGAIPVEKRGLAKVSFSRAYFINRVGLLTLNQTKSFWDYFSFLFDKILNIKLTLILLVFLVFCHVLWWSERGESLPKAYWSGIGHAMWLGFTSFVINDATKTKRARTRFILVLWFLLSVTTLATFTASITSALTMSLFSHSKTVTMVNLYDDPVAVVKDKVDATLVQRLRVRPVYTKNLKEAVALLKMKKVSAVIDDLPHMQFYLYEHPSKILKISPEILGYDEYAFVFQKNSPLLNSFDLRLDELKSTSKLKDICIAYVGQHGALLCDI